MKTGDVVTIADIRARFGHTGFPHLVLEESGYLKSVAVGEKEWGKWEVLKDIPQDISYFTTHDPRTAAILISFWLGRLARRIELMVNNSPKNLQDIIGKKYEPLLYNLRAAAEESIDFDFDKVTTNGSVIIPFPMSDEYYYTNIGIKHQLEAIVRAANVLLEDYGVRLPCLDFHLVMPSYLKNEY